MSRPTIAGLTGDLEYERQRRAEVEARLRAAREDEKDAREALGRAEQINADLEHRLRDALYAAAYWLGRAHQAVGIPDDQQGRPIADLVTYTSPAQNGFGWGR